MVSVILHLPDNILAILKAIFDVLLFVTFIFLVVIIFILRKRFPLFEKKKIFYPLLSFGILGTLSSLMNAYDEFFWFNPKSFYDQIWKPTKLGLMVIAIILLVVMFFQFYQLSKRLLGEE
ncbi:MAG: hypothetical protein K9W45_12185 [Candidatus Heimdallarchaeum aukensis]|uniref:Uncharacterized protein n=1 Tax=Candidatus Heimdallarchaeum aukensis TaxID=2876573 RepID=A0A9Y1BLR7_9ARCH|nr:MAG: hypothetical protein K9W45_12185 [Candidatus Heimdallarchaeum aukensis]